MSQDYKIYNLITMLEDQNLNNFMVLIQNDFYHHKNTVSMLQ